MTDAGRPKLSADMYALLATCFSVVSVMSFAHLSLGLGRSVIFATSVVSKDLVCKFWSLYVEVLLMKQGDAEGALGKYREVGMAFLMYMETSERDSCSPFPPSQSKENRTNIGWS